MESELYTQPEELFLSENSRLHQLTVELLAKADVAIGGRRPWDLQLKAPCVPERVFAHGGLGFGEAYMVGDWDVQQLDELFFRLLRARIGQRIRPLRLTLHSLSSRLLNRQNIKRAWRCWPRELSR